MLNKRDEIFEISDFIPDADSENRPVYLLLNLPMYRCRARLWHTLLPDEDPFVKSLVQYRQYPGLRYQDTALFRYYRDYQPRTAAAVLQIKDHSGLNWFPAQAYFLPWESRSPQEVYRKRKRVVFNENLRYGKWLSLAKGGHTDFGPVSEEKGALEFTRLKKVFDSIKDKGYREDPRQRAGAVRGYFVKDGNRWCFMIQSGKHRAYALSALGYKNLPVCVRLHSDSVKNRDDIADWKQVKEGRFTQKETEQLIKKLLRDY